MLRPPFIIRRSCAILGLFLAPAFLNAQDETVDARIRNLTTDPAALAKGEAIYRSMCFSCHGKDLEGATGFNLKDSEWIHGSSPSEIVDSVKRGFPEKGMLAFENVYDEATIEATVAFILSKGEGFRDLSYQIYPKAQNEDITFAELSLLTPVSKGSIANGIARPELSELSNYAMLFEAELLARPEDHPRLEIETNARTWAKLEIDGVEIETAEDSQRVFGAPLQRSQKVRLLLLADNPRTIMRLEIHSDTGVTPLSTDSINHLNKTTFLRTADQRPLVIRTSIDQLPSKSIAVIQPQGIGYALHAPTASIVGLWTGNVFNIGPNIEGRGREPSRPEGEWLLRDPVGLALQINGKPTPFSLEKYSRDSDNPIFTSSAGKYRILILATSVDDKSLQVSYRFLGPKPKSVALSIPAGIVLVSDDGSTADGQFRVAKDKRAAFTLTLSR